MNEIATRLYEDIVVGVYPFGNKLVEERLVDTYGTKRHILRDAFGHLEELGFVERIPNRGVYVREPHPTEVHELYQLRSLLEKHALSEIKLPVPAETIDRMSHIQEQHTAAIRATQFRDVLHLNSEFHRAQYSACENKTLISAIEYYAARTHLITTLKFDQPEVMERIIAQHLAIIDAMKSCDHDVLERCVENHFNMARVDQYEHEYNLRHNNDGAGLNVKRPFGSQIKLNR